MQQSGIQRLILPARLWRIFWYATQALLLHKMVMAILLEYQLHEAPWPSLTGLISQRSIPSRCDAVVKRASSSHMYVHVYSITVSTKGKVLHVWHMREAAEE